MIAQLKISLFITLLLTATIPVTVQYSGGTGTEEDPYQIASPDDLQTLSLTPADWNKNFMLTTDIDASDTENWNNGKGFSPIGEYGDPFTGSFDGRKHTISGLYISRKDEDKIGLFGLISGANIRDLILENFQIEGRQQVGALAGTIGPLATETSKIKFVICRNCSIKGVVVVGGLTGLSGAIINDCRFEGSVSGSVSVIGGLAATNIGTIVNNSVSGEIFIDAVDNDYIGGVAATNNRTIRNCYTSVTITAEKSYYLGGPAGENQKRIETSYSFGDVTGKNSVGGLIGKTTDGSQTINCYSTATVTGEDKTGGLVGENSYFVRITDCYASGEVNSDAWFAGGLAGLNRSTAHTVNCFFDKETSGKEKGIGMDHNGQNQEVTGLETIDFDNQIIFEEAGWQFGNTTDAPWKTGMAPDGRKRPVFYYHEYTVTFLADTGGQLQPESHLVQTVMCGNNSDSITAVANYGRIFKNWQTLSGESITNLNPLVVFNVTSDTTLVAVFQFIDKVHEIFAGQFSVSPIPVKTYVSFKYSLPVNAGKASIEIRNLAGQPVHKFTLHDRKGETVWMTVNTTPGVYIYVLKTTVGFKTGKIVVAR